MPFCVLESAIYREMVTLELFQTRNFYKPQQTGVSSL